MEWIGWIVTAAGTAGGAAIGGAIGLKGARSLSREERAAAAHELTQRAFSSFMSTLAASVGELRELPPTPKSPLIDAANALDRRVRGEARMYLATRRREQQISGGRHRELATRLGSAYLELTLQALPPSVREAVQEGMDYVERLGVERTPENLAEWRAIHGRLLAANRALRETGPTAVAPETLPSDRSG